jgi:hypothetical protein
MTKAMDNNVDLEEAIISLNENKQITTNIGRDIVLDLSVPEYEYQRLMYPVHMIDEYSAWRKEFNKYWNYESEKMSFWDAFEEKVINSFNRYHLPVIIMKKENPKEAVCQVFEKVNTGGVALTVFELLTATYASDDFDLKQDWSDIKTTFNRNLLLNTVSNTDIIQAVTLLSTYQKRVDSLKRSLEGEELATVSCKRKDMLSLTKDDYVGYREKIVHGYIRASKLLIENHIYNSRDIPYNTQLIPLSAIVAVLDDEIENVGNKTKLMQWYWCGVLGELYGSANETRYALDLPQVVEWILKHGPLPKTIYEANFTPNRLHTLRTRNSAAYKGIYALMLEDGTRDWLSATKIDLTNYFSDSIDIHHIFPVAWCEKNSISRADYDCIINKTPLSGRTNRIVSGDAPGSYLPRIQKNSGVSDEAFQSILQTHVLSPNFLYSNDFMSFFFDRKEQILRRIELAMNKSIPRDVVSQEESLVVDSYNDLCDDQDMEYLFQQN